jgi:UDP-GlcNAc:undecaprenyl-phosphate GlcNAc-1-phosphate transferase
MALILGILLGIIGTAVSMKLAVRVGALDHPSALKIHASPTPTLGGLGILSGSIFSSLLLMYLSGDCWSLALPMITGSLVVFAVGLIDDLTGLKPIQKITGQVLAALVYVVMSMHTRIELAVSEFLWVTVLTVGLSNSLNLFDGIDGALAGTAAIMALTGSVVSQMSGNPYWTIILLTVAGGCIGFLVFNLPPARTFMGDCGSLYLGHIFGLAIYRLGFLALRPTRNVFGWMLIMAVPVCDTAFAIVRRTVGRSGVLLGDRRHMYDRLSHCLDGDVLKTDLIIWSMTAVLGLLGVCAIRNLNSYWPPILVIIAYTVLFCVGRLLG